MSAGREHHSWHHPEDNDQETGPSRQTSLKDPPSMHLRHDMAKRNVKMQDGTKRVMECALTWDEFTKKHGIT